MIHTVPEFGIDNPSCVRIGIRKLVATFQTVTSAVMRINMARKAILVQHLSEKTASFKNKKWQKTVIQRKTLSAHKKTIGDICNSYRK